MVVESALSQTGYVRYTKLLSGIFSALTATDLAALSRAGEERPLLLEASDLQNRRNGVVHRGEEVSENEASTSLAVSAAVYVYVLANMLSSLGLQRSEQGVICKMRVAGA